MLTAFHPTSPDFEATCAGAFSPLALLESLRPNVDALGDVSGMQPSGLSTKLHTYQLQALRWLVARETAGSGTTSSGIDRPGGLLCEEMGLGKTVEIIALVHSHRLKSKEAKAAAAAVAQAAHAAAGSADASARPRVSGATLIVTPSTIAPQWESELKRHASALKWVRYTAASKDLDALAKADIVLVTYDVLQSEYHFLERPSDARSEGSLRHAKRYKWEQSPLMQLVFWRVILDEVQLCPGSKMSGKTARRVHAVNRWAVTGTPVSNGGLADLEPLLHFTFGDAWLQAAGWDAIAAAYKQQRAASAVAARNALLGLLWRQTKAHVFGEVTLPPQHTCTLTLELSPVEKLYHDQFVLRCARVRLEENASHQVFSQLKYALLAPPTCGDPEMKSNPPRRPWALESLNEDGDPALFVCLQYAAHREFNALKYDARRKYLDPLIGRLLDADFNILSDLARLAYVARGASSAVAQAAFTLAYTMRVAEYKQRGWWPSRVECHVQGWTTSRSATSTLSWPYTRTSSSPEAFEAIASELCPESGTARLRTCWELLDTWGPWKPGTFDLYQDPHTLLWTRRHSFPATRKLQTIRDIMQYIDPRKRSNELVYSLIPSHNLPDRVDRLERLAFLREVEAWQRIGYALSARQLLGPHAIPDARRSMQSVLCSPPNALASALPTVSLNETKGTLSTKITRLVQLLSSIAPAKAVVFASYNEGGLHVTQALQRFGIGVVRVKGKGAAKALQTFNDDPTCRVCMLHTGQDAAGLTLTVAQHVVFLDVVEDVGTVKQAIGRVHRIGQTKETFVWHLIAADTVEEALHQRLRALVESQEDTGGGTGGAGGSGGDGGGGGGGGVGALTREGMHTLLYRPLDYYSARRARAGRFWCAAACSRLTGRLLPDDCLNKLFGM